MLLTLALSRRRSAGLCSHLDLELWAEREPLRAKLGEHAPSPTRLGVAFVRESRALRSTLLAPELDRFSAGHGRPVLRGTDPRWQCSLRARAAWIRCLWVSWWYEQSWTRFHVWNVAHIVFPLGPAGIPDQFGAHSIDPQRRRVPES